MTPSSGAAGAAGTPDPPGTPEHPDGPARRATRREQWIEVAAVLWLAWIPSFAWALLFYSSDSSWTPGFWADSIDLLVRSLSICVITLFVIWRSADAFAAFGLVRPRLLRDVGLALLFFFPASVIIARGSDALAYAFDLVPFAPLAEMVTATQPQNAPQWALFLVAHGANAVAEELAMRGFLLVRLQRLLDSTFAAVLVSTAIFASYHIWQGPIGVASALVAGFVLAGLFLITRRLWVPILVHAMYNLSLTLFPLILDALDK